MRLFIVGVTSIAAAAGLTLACGGDDTNSGVSAPVDGGSSFADANANDGGAASSDGAVSVAATLLAEVAGPIVALDVGDDASKVYFAALSKLFTVGASPTQPEELGPGPKEIDGLVVAGDTIFYSSDKRPPITTEVAVLKTTIADLKSGAAPTVFFTGSDLASRNGPGPMTRDATNLYWASLSTGAAVRACPLANASCTEDTSVEIAYDTGTADRLHASGGHIYYRSFNRKKVSQCPSDVGCGQTTPISDVSIDDSSKDTIFDLAADGDDVFIMTDSDLEKFNSHTLQVFQKKRGVFGAKALATVNVATHMAIDTTDIYVGGGATTAIRRIPRNKACASPGCPIALTGPMPEGTQISASIVAKHGFVFWAVQTKQAPVKGMLFKVAIPPPQ